MPPSISTGTGNVGEKYVIANNGDRAILRSVAAGGAELQLGTEPDLFLDGRCCCDQLAANRLVRAGFIATTTLGLGQRVAVALTPAGQQALGAYALAA